MFDDSIEAYNAVANHGSAKIYHGKELAIDPNDHIKAKEGVNQAREEQVSRIESLILKRMNTKRAHLMARRLERELYKRADSFNAYQDTRTLKRRVKILALEIGNKKKSGSPRSVSLKLE